MTTKILISAQNWFKIYLLRSKGVNVTLTSGDTAVWNLIWACLY